MPVRHDDYPQIDVIRTGRLLRELSHRENISVKEIQLFLGLSSNQAVYEWFNGKSLPTLNNFLALSRLLCRTMEDMLIIRNIIKAKDWLSIDFQSESTTVLLESLSAVNPCVSGNAPEKRFFPILEKFSGKLKSRYR